MNSLGQPCGGGRLFAGSRSPRPSANGTATTRRASRCELKTASPPLPPSILRARSMTSSGTPSVSRPWDRLVNGGRRIHFPKDMTGGSGSAASAKRTRPGAGHSESTTSRERRNYDLRCSAGHLSREERPCADWTQGRRRHVSGNRGLPFCRLRQLHQFPLGSLHDGLARASASHTPPQERQASNVTSCGERLTSDFRQAARAGCRRDSHLRPFAPVCGSRPQRHTIRGCEPLSRRRESICDVANGPRSAQTCFCVARRENFKENRGVRRAG